MAYLDFAVTDVLVSSYPPVTPSPRRLNGAERTAVMLARSDRPSSPTGTGYLYKMGEAVFGLRRPNKLADIQLETLRRFAIAVAHNRPRLAEWEANELRLFHYSEQEIGEASALAAQFRRPRSQGGWINAAFAMLLVAAFLWAKTCLDDSTVALIAVAIVAVPFWAVIAPRKVRPGPAR